MGRPGNYQDGNLNGVRVRTCGDCGETKPLTRSFYELRTDLAGEPKYRGTCRQCGNAMVRAGHNKRMADPDFAAEFRSKARAKNRERRESQRVHIPAGTQLASCPSCCKVVESGYYVYGHELPEYGFFYIGKGSGIRAWQTDLRSEVWKTFVAQRLKHGVIVHILHQGLTEEAAYELEKTEISQRGRKIDGTGPLLNLDEGGRGSSSDERKAFWAEKKKDPEFAEKKRAHAKAVLHNAEVRAKAIRSRESNVEYVNSRAERLRGYSSDPETVQKALDSRANNPHWRQNVVEGARRRFANSEKLAEHQELMQSKEWKAAHSAGVKEKFNKPTRMYFPSDWGHPGYFVDFENRTEMCEAMNFTKGHVSSVLTGKRAHYRNFTFDDAPLLHGEEQSLD